MLYDLLTAIPMTWVSVLVVDLTLVVLWWALTLPDSFIFRGAPDRARWRDLRIWVAATLVLQINIYIIF